MPALHLSQSAKKVLESRFLKRNEKGVVVETAEECFLRVARHIAAPEKKWSKSNQKKWEGEFLRMMMEGGFLPNSPTLVNAGTEIHQYSACFVLPIEDSMEEIFESLKLMALIQQSGGGTGFSFSHLRSKGERVSKTGGVASGPVSFLRIYDSATENIRQGGRRRGANMGVLRVDHPDIEEFISAKSDGVSIQNFNLSVSVTDAFMKAVDAKEQFDLKDPHTGKKKGTLDADKLFHRIAECAWKTGDPGLLFINQIEKKNPTPQIGKIEATNPCGEVPLLPYEACNLGSINLGRMVKKEGESFTIDWGKLETTAHWAVRFLDNVIEANSFVSPKIEEKVRGNRKIGLGVMGFADLLILLGIPYDSIEAVKIADSVMRVIQKAAWEQSEELAKKRGVFPNWKKSIFGDRKMKVRNATCTSIAPTGTISIVAGTSSSIEPLFAIAYQRHALDGQVLTDLNPLFLDYLKKNKLYSQELVEAICREGSLGNRKDVPDEMRSLFKTALEIAPSVHLGIQQAFQKHVDNAVSKTINLPESASVEDVREAYWSAWKQGLKGVTVFRYGSKGKQVLELGSNEKFEEREYFTHCDPTECRL